MRIPFPLTLAAQAAANLYLAGAAARAGMYRTGWQRQRRLRARVVSIGNIAWGGTGKTPFTIWLAQRLAAAGARASILTRGYGRPAGQRVLVLSPGASADQARRCGDEAQLYLRHGIRAPIGVAASRYQAGHAVEEQFPIDVHLLDDGFQHLALARDLDIVLIDARNPWGARWGIERLLREPLSSLRRADALLLTNCEDWNDAADSEAFPRPSCLEAILAQWNPRAPRFHSRPRIEGFLSAQDGETLRVEELRGRRAAVFCGLGNPANFLARLRQSGVECVAQRTFADHHRYRPRDMQRLEQLARRHRADLLITTEKDLVNLPENLPLPLPLYWVKMELVVREEARLLEWLLQKLGMAVGTAAERGSQDAHAVPGRGAAAFALRLP